MLLLLYPAWAGETPPTPSPPETFGGGGLVSKHSLKRGVDALNVRRNRKKYAHIIEIFLMSDF